MMGFVFKRVLGEERNGAEEKPPPLRNDDLRGKA